MNGHSATPTSSSPRTDGRPPAAGGPMGGGPMRGGPMAMMNKAEKPRDFKGTLTKLVQYLGQISPADRDRLVAGNCFNRGSDLRSQNPRHSHHRTV